MMADFALKLPGFGLIPGITMSIIKYWDGQPLRYVTFSSDQTGLPSSER